MYKLQKINVWEHSPTLATFYDDLPTNPYCTNEKGTCFPRHKPNGIKYAYIQPNHPASIKWLVFDLDDPNALFAYHDNNLPRPQIIIKNPENGHAHYCYKLATEVGMWGKSSVRAINYLTAVYRALNRALGGDMAFGGNLIKNPFHNDHETYITGAKPSYTLAELGEYLDLSQKYEPQANNDDHFGRNCATFHHTRMKAYPLAHLPQSELFRQVLAIASEHNAQFDSPMLANELKHIAGSITRYCKSPRFQTYQKASRERFSEKQAIRGAKGGKVSKRPPSEKSERTRKPWESLGISRKTYYKRKQKLGLGGDQISHNQILAP